VHPLCGWNLKDFPMAHWCLFNIDSSLSGMASRLVKGLGFSESYGTRHSALPRRVALRRAQSKLDCVSGIPCKRKTNSDERLAPSDELGEFPDVYTGISRAKERFLLPRAATRSPSSAHRRETRCYDCYYYCNYYRTTIYTQCTAAYLHKILRFYRA